MENYRQAENRFDLDQMVSDLIENQELDDLSDDVKHKETENSLNNNLLENHDEMEVPFNVSFAYAKRQGVIVKTDVSSSELSTSELSTLEHSTAETIVFCRSDVDPLTIAELVRISPVKLSFKFIDFDEFESLLHSTYEQGGNRSIENIDLGDNVDLLSVAQQLAEPEDLLESEDDAPIIRLINAILAEAIKENASDIHIEPFEQRLVVRLRVDGILREVIQPPKELGRLLVSRIKVMAQLDIAEKRIPQDGRISLKLAGKAIDVRVSTLPTGGG